MLKSSCAGAAVALALATMLPAQSLNTGPEAGEKIPAFEAVDQNGRTRTFEDLKGPNGLLLLVHRSADW